MKYKNITYTLITIVCCLLAMPLQVLATQVQITTNLGDIVVELNEEKAPITVANFLSYVERQAYDNTIFHRVIPGFMVQGGGYYRDLTEAPDGEMITNEAANGLSNSRGTIAMARFSEIDSASRQFFINVTDNDYLDHQPDSCTRADEAAVAEAAARGMRKPLTCKSYGYAVFGRVVSGMEIVDLIELTETRAVGEFDDVPTTPVVILSVRRLDDALADS